MPKKLHTCYKIFYQRNKQMNKKFIKRRRTPQSKKQDKKEITKTIRGVNERIPSLSIHQKRTGGAFPFSVEDYALFATPCRNLFRLSSKGGKNSIPSDFR